MAAASPPLPPPPLILFLCRAMVLRSTKPKGSRVIRSIRDARGSRVIRGSRFIRDKSMRGSMACVSRNIRFNRSSRFR